MRLPLRIGTMVVGVAALTASTAGAGVLNEMMRFVGLGWSDGYQARPPLRDRSQPAPGWRPQSQPAPHSYWPSEVAAPQPGDPHSNAFPPAFPQSHSNFQPPQPHLSQPHLSQPHLSQPHLSQPHFSQPQPNFPQSAPHSQSAPAPNLGSPPPAVESPPENAPQLRPNRGRLPAPAANPSVIRETYRQHRSFQ